MVNTALSAVRSGSVQSIDRAMEVLRVLARRPQGATALELAAVTGLDRTTVHRLLRTLSGAAMVEARGSSYVLGPACTLLGAGRLHASRLRDTALPFAVDIQRADVGDRPLVVSITCCALDEVVIVDRIWTPFVPLNIIVGIGWRFPIDESVSGRSMLSTMSDAAIAALIGIERFERLLPRLSVIRAQDGMEFGSDERHAGVSTMAYPFVGTDGIATGAMVVAGIGLAPELHLESPIARHLVRSAQAVSRLLHAAT
ncbi:MAG: IclR family transcriptional regulator [Archangium gephyra]|uniref:IclR family transcriptional regulator n=1 Tax=Archangium gephyra TaxID=48 RepID=A0A2W5TZL0_9BACT|nr:MAG: IclR family transcriptional regulator [Archangium gephyra]